MTQYRMLKAGEIIKDGDEFVPYGHDTKKNVWLRAGKTIGESLEHCSVGYYRRRIHSKIKTKEAKTESPQYRFLVAGERIAATDETNLMSREWYSAYTYDNYVVASTHTKNFRRKVEAAPTIAESTVTPVLNVTLLKELEERVSKLERWVKTGERIG